MGGHLVRGHAIRSHDHPAVPDEQSVVVGLQLSRAEEITGHDLQRTCALDPISDVAANRGEQIEDIVARRQREIGDSSNHFPGRWQDIERISARLTRTIEHELPQRRVEGNVHIDAGRAAPVGCHVANGEVDVLS